MFIILPLTFHYKDEGTLTEKGKEKIQVITCKKKNKNLLVFANPTGSDVIMFPASIWF